MHQPEATELGLHGGSFPTTCDALRKALRTSQGLLECLPTAVFACDRDGRIVLWNGRASELWGRSPREGETWTDYTDSFVITLANGDLIPEMPIFQALRTGAPVARRELIVVRPDGRHLTVLATVDPLFDDAGTVIGCVACHDVSAHQESEQERRRLVAQLTSLNETLEQRVEERTRALVAEIEERRALEAQLYQMQKTEALGQLTGGIAHDFNNLLTVVLGNLDLIGAKADDDSVRRHADAAARAAQRGASLTQQLLAFSRKQRLDPKPASVNELVTGMGELLLRTLGGTVRVEMALGEGLWPALIDVNQTESAILNLVINARDAMPDGGTVTVETANLRVGKITAPVGLAAGDYVVIAVSDNGIGMTDEVKERAFDPFFTTKDVGKGSGLGLSQVYGVARQSGGGADLDSAPGKGTTVRIYLPRAQAYAVEAPPRDTARRLKGEARDGIRVLVVDDDDDVREVMTVTLEGQGHRVIETRCASDAISLLERQPFDLVVMDFAMPDMNGAQAGRVVRERWPDIPVLYVSGHPQATALDDDIPELLVLHKPFLASDLEIKVRAILDRRTAIAASGNVVRLRAGGD